MRVLWVCNIMLPAIAVKLHREYSNREGWLSGIFAKLQEEEESQITLGICYPVAESAQAEKLMLNETACYGFLEDLGKPEQYEPGMEVRFREILDDFKPEVVHIFGTEFPHTLATVKAFGRPERTLIGIQGLCFQIASTYMAGLPKRVVKQVTLRDWLRKDSLRQQQQKFRKRGKNEIEALRLTGHVTGRTSFDLAGTRAVNKEAVYHFMNETMRQDFYTGIWQPEQCVRHTIFLGQGDYPLKGFHFVLQALAIIQKQFPDVKLLVAGSNVIADHTLKDRLKLSAYGKYLRRLIRDNQLQEKLQMLGRLSAGEMKQQYLNSSVFVCASVLENSPNTVGEAMLLGVPVICARVGGIPDMLTDGEEGYLFPAGDVQALADKITALWQDEDTVGTETRRISKNARDRAARTHDGATNYNRLLEIYQEIAEKGEVDAADHDI